MPPISLIIAGIIWIINEEYKSKKQQVKDKQKIKASN